MSAGPAGSLGGAGSSVAGSSGSANGGTGGRVAAGGAAGTAAQGGVGTAGSAGSAQAGVGGSGGSSGSGGMGGAPGPFELTSSAFSDGDGVEVKYRCTGANVSPALTWTRGPLGTLSYAVTMIHVGSQSLHWVLWDVAADTRTLAEGVPRLPELTVPAGAKQVETNIDGATWAGYTGPCPGGADQSYTFFVYALDVATLPGITTASSAMQADAAVKAHELAVAELTGTASKQ